MTTAGIWTVIGFLGQGVFTARFLVQWAASEKKKQSVVPVAFWWLSIVGAGILLTYAIYREDPVIIAGQSLGFIVYIRNLMLVGKHRRREAKLASAVPAPMGIHVKESSRANGPH